ncbi:hypothetical protein [Bacillus sp. 1P06AnD]|uniref:hypothetical protein n=1 Tax=Bacillus sp. 1P06AnD TaxID=3132208 RepID=UPI0039A3EC5D
MYDQQTICSIQKAEFQIHHVLGLMEQKEGFKKIVDELGEAREDINSAIDYSISNHMVHCIQGSKMSPAHDQQLSDAVQLIIKSR